MALQVWFPMNRDSLNRGVSTNKFSRWGCTSTDTGKIGMCYIFDGEDDRFYTTNFSIENQWSICAWYYLDEPFEDSNLGYIISLNNSAGAADQQLCIFMDANGISTYANAKGYSLDSAPTVGEWTHVAATFDGTYTKCYINGVLRGTSNANPNSIYRGLNLTIGARSTNANGAGHGAGYFFKGKLNDVRLYDNVLSAKEIKLISQALMIHLPLSTVRTNNIMDSIHSASSNATVSSDKQSIIISNDNEAGQVDTWFSLNLLEDVNSDDDYTISFDVVGIREGIDEIRYYVGEYLDANTITLKNGRNFLHFKFLSTDTNALTNKRLILDDDETTRPDMGVYRIFNFKIEKSINPEPLFTPKEFNTSTDIEYEYDASGNTYHGYMSNFEKNGPLMDYTSPRNDGRCYLFNDIYKTIIINNIATNGITNSFTISWWANIPQLTSRMMWAFATGVRMNVYVSNDVNIYLNNADGHGNPFSDADGNLADISAYFDSWHHWVLTGDGTTNRLYIDGEEIATSKTYLGPASTATSGNQILCISGWNANGNAANSTYRYIGMKMSDFRLYGTCLSAKEIKELGSTTISFCNNGTVVSLGEFKE